MIPTFSLAGAEDVVAAHADLKLVVKPHETLGLLIQCVQALDVS